MILTTTFFPVWSQSLISGRSLETHYRLTFATAKEQLFFEKNAQSLSVKTLNKELFQKIQADFGGFKTDPKYISKIEFQDQGPVGHLLLNFSNQDVEYFNFYQSKDGQHIVDFWIDQKKMSQEELKTQTSLEEKSPKAQKKLIPALLNKPQVIKKPVAQDDGSKNIFKFHKDYRDFRYGAPLIWDYDPLSPQIRATINLERKTAEYFYPIKDRDFEKNNEEAHLQMIINLYRKQKYGLMYKAMKLYIEKNGDNKHVDLLEYLKANAVLKDILVKKDPTMLKTVHNMYKAIMERTNVYDLKKALLKYLIQQDINDKNMISCLELGKKLYVSSQENFDKEESKYAIEIMLYSLAKLGQIEKIDELVKDKTVAITLPKQTLYSYKIYVLLKQQKNQDAIDLYEGLKTSLAKPIDGTILFNVGEAYFREARFDEAIKIFDDFLVFYSHFSYASLARLRMALSYEISEKDIKQTQDLYENAINRSSDLKIAFEARLRYVSLTTIRKLNPTPRDLENRDFLDTNTLNSEMDLNLKKLLWLVRLRTFIVDKSYFKALTYLNAIAVASFKPSESRVFNGDGAEIVYALIEQSFNEMEYSKIIRYWEVYKDKFVDKVAMDPYLNFIVGQSYVKLGLFNSFEKLYAEFEKLKESPYRSYPIWIERNNSSNKVAMIQEIQILKHIKLKNWSVALEKTVQFQKDYPSGNKTHYYFGIVYYNLKEFKKAATSFENFLSSKTKLKLYDMTEAAEMLNAYIDSVYEMGETEKFRKLVSALISDTEHLKGQNKLLNGVRERGMYLSIEMSSADKETDAIYVIEDIEKFKKEFDKSLYTPRIQYLLATSLIKKNRVTEGKEILKNLIEDKNTADYLKELSKSELSILEIKNLTL